VAKSWLSFVRRSDRTIGKNKDKMITKLMQDLPMRRPSILAQLWCTAAMLGLVMWSGLLLHHQLWFVANNNAHHHSVVADIGSSLTVNGDSDFGSPQLQPTTPTDSAERGAKAALPSTLPLSASVEQVNDEKQVEWKVVVEEEWR